MKLQTKPIQDKIFKAKKLSKIGCDGQILIPAFALFLTNIKFYFLKTALHYVSIQFQGFSGIS